MARKILGLGIDRVGGLSLHSARNRRLMEERFATMVALMPALYSILLVDLVALLVSANAGAVRHPLALVLLVALTARLVSWRRLSGARPRGLTARRHMRRMVVNSALLSFMHTLLILDLYSRSGHSSYLMLFGIVSAIGAAHAMSIFPGAARLPILLLGLPLALRLFLENSALESAIGASLLTLSLVSLRIIAAMDRNFVAEVDARMLSQQQRRRAERAEQLAKNERLVARRASETDFLTGLANRRALVASIDQSLADGRTVGLILVDLDGFKPVNDTFGHKAGDELLRQVADRTLDLFPDARCIARLGGDEFAIQFDGLANPRRQLGRHARRLIARLGEPYQIDDLTVAVSACCGHSARQESDTPTLMGEADLALYQAKRSGHSQAAGFTRTLRDQVQRRTAVENALRIPGAERDIELAFQPVVDLMTRDICAFEALARWRHSTLGPISPAEFIPISEQILVIERVSDALLAAAAREAASWPASVRLAFNLSAVQLCAVGSGERLCALVRRHGLDPARLKIEVTETAMMADFDRARANLSALRRQGVQVVLDDFGAGYASISYLSEIEFDLVKLDGSLVESGRRSDKGAALLRGVIELCAGIGIPCVAEQVESEPEAQRLAALGCRFGQGFWLGRPMDSRAARRLVQRDARDSVAARPVDNRQVRAA